MTELSALLEQAGCPPAQERHRLDCLVRWLLANGWGGEPLDIRAGIGRLRIGNGTQIWEPTIRAAPPEPMKADEETQKARQIACDSCDRWQGKCTASGGCGCSGLGKPQNKFSKCPLGKWAS